MKNNKLRSKFTILFLGLIITLLSIAGCKSTSELDNSNKISETQISKEQKDLEGIAEISIKGNKEPALILFNAKKKEVSYQKGGQVGDIHYINGETVGAIEESIENAKGLVPYKEDNKLFFVDLDYNTLIEVNAENDELIIDLILKDQSINLSNIKEMSVVDGIMCLTLDKGQVITISLHDKVINKYMANVNASNLFKLNDEFYFMDKAHLVKNSVENGKLKETKRIELGAMLTDFRVDGEYFYALNMFGKKENNSVLMKIDLNEFKVKNIMPLKGLDSAFIGVDGDITYISQKDSIKEVNISTFEPLRSFQREEGKNVQYINSNLYKLIDGKLEKIDLESLKVIDSLDTNFSDFHVGGTETKVTTKSANTEIIR